MDATKGAQAYIAIRDERERLKREFEAKDAELKEQLDILNQEFLTLFKQTGTNSLSTNFGTITRKVDTQYYPTNWDAMYKFVMEHNVPHLLQRRVAKLNMKEFLEENPDLMPEGLNVNSTYVVSVRRK